MSGMTDIEIAQRHTMKPIVEVAKSIGMDPAHLDLYGNYKAKLNLPLSTFNDTPDGKLILVTAITPTPAGEGKTTTSVGLGDALSLIGKKTMIALREPSLGPVFGMKGGATGGGYSQVVPMEEINLHFTGDFHAIGAANNLLAALIDNHIFQGNALNIDPRRISWKRAVDMNDRQLRSIISGLDGRKNGTPREDGFDITVASEVMAILCLSKDIDDLKARLAKIIIGYTFDNMPVTAGDLKAEGAMAVLLKEALKPNLVQTLAHTPVLLHGGPFANIAHGCNTILATKFALKYADYVVTEAGFGADLGAEKFLDIKCPAAGISPSAVVIVATVRALKMHGGVKIDQLSKPNIKAVIAGLPNLEKHLDTIKNVYELPCTIAINRFPTDSDDEIETIQKRCAEYGVNVIVSNVWAEGGNGATALAHEVVRLAENHNGSYKKLYNGGSTVEEKLHQIVTKVYGGREVILTASAKTDLKLIAEIGLDHLPICVAKTQYSFSDDKKKLGRPTDFAITIRNFRVSAGAGFIVALSGTMMTMPGLPRHPASERIDLSSDGKISGLF